MSYKESDRLWEQFLLESEKLDRGIERVQEETIEAAKLIISNPSSYPLYAVDAAKDILKR